MYSSLQSVTTNEIIILYRNSHNAHISVSPNDSKCGERRDIFCISLATEHLLNGVGKVIVGSGYLATVRSSMLLL